jgi:hypothetical protein
MKPSEPLLRRRTTKVTPIVPAPLVTTKPNAFADQLIADTLAYWLSQAPTPAVVMKDAASQLHMSEYRVMQAVKLPWRESIKNPQKIKVVFFRKLDKN